MNNFNDARTIVLVVDMVKGFCTTGALASENCNGVASGIAKLLGSLENAEIAFIRDCHKAESVEFNSFPPHCIKGTIECELVDELKTFDGIDVEKNSTNAYFALTKKIPNLFDRFDNFVLVGVCTDICVLQLGLTLKTAIDEDNLKNKEVSVIAPLTHTFDIKDVHESKQMNEIALALMKQSGIKIIYNEDISVC